MSPSTTPGGPREWATRAVQWNKARNTIKYGVHGYAEVRGRWLGARGHVPDVANIYAASSPKGGSQWMKALFNHPVVREHTGLFTLPQLDYQQSLDRVFPAGTFVPGVYCSYDEYRQMPKPLPHRTVYMFRDPRDLLVSGYHSAVTTHRVLNDKALEAYRDELRAMSFDDALLSLIRANGQRLRETASWTACTDPLVKTFRLEEAESDPRTTVDAMLRHCGVTLSEGELRALLDDVSRDAMQARDLATRAPGSESHYRVERKTFRDVFTPEHYAALEEVAPSIAVRMGYEA